MKKLIKLTVVMLVALMAMPSIAMAKESDSYLEAVSNAVAREVSEAQQNICEISGYDCKEIVALFYEMRHNKGYTYDRVKGAYIVVEPYATQLKEMNITVRNIEHDRGGGVMIYVVGGRMIYLHQEFDEPEVEVFYSVKTSDGRKFAFSYDEIYAVLEEKYSAENSQR